MRRSRTFVILMILAGLTGVAILTIRVWLSIDPDPRRSSHWRDPNPGQTSPTGLSSQDRTRLVHSLYLSEGRIWGAFVHGAIYHREADLAPVCEVELLLKYKNDSLLRAAVSDAAKKHDFESVRQICARLAKRYPGP